mgnify:CR=1 FL=1
MDQAYPVDGLKEPAEIIVDRWGIPHIYAKSEHDVFLAQGFNAARDRLWQIDLWRRRGLGLRQVPEDVVEAARSFGATSWQQLIAVELPLAMPSIMAGVNQAVMMSLAMVVIAYEARNTLRRQLSRRTLTCVAALLVLLSACYIGRELTAVYRCAGEGVVQP